MTNIDPTAPQYEYEWQNPNRKSFDFGRTFSRTIDILKLRGLKMCGMTLLLLGVPIALISLWPMLMAGSFADLGASDDVSEMMALFSGGALVVLVIGGLLTLLGSLWVQPALIKISYGALTNEDIPTMSLLKQVSRFVLPVLGFYILYSLGVMFGLLLLIIPGVFLALGWMLAGQIIVLEGVGVTDALSRAWELSKGSKRWILLLAIVFGVIGAIVGAVLSIPLYLMGDPSLALIEGQGAAYWIVNAVVSSASQVIGSVIGVAWGTSAYVEIRKLKEGVDPESQVDVFS